MENPPSPEHTAAVGSDNGRESICDGIRVDDERQHQRVSEGGRQRGPVTASKTFVQVFIITSHSRLRDCLAWRCNSGVDLYARSGDDPW